VDREISSVGIVVHRERQDALTYAKQAEACLRSRGVRVSYPQLNGDGARMDVILTFGGDGTLLAGAGYAMNHGIPLLGFNLGTVGFLTEAEADQIEDRLDRMMQGRYMLEERSLLAIDNPQTGEHFTALNDVVVTRGGYARLIRVESYINQEFHDMVTADGLIVATPTGSTGYSLSAGGPVIDPSMRCMVVTPVCAHSFRHCPTVVSAEAGIRLRLMPNRDQTAELQIDGQNRGTLKSGDEILVSGSEKTLQLIRFGPYRFYDLTRRKLTEWGSGPA